MQSSMTLTGKLQGFEEFDRLLKELPGNVQNNVLQAAVTAGARVASNAIEAAAPIDNNRPPQTNVSYWGRKIRYGRLKDDISAKTSKRDRSDGQRGAYVSTGVGFWGFFLEKGTRYIAAKPWFEPAFAAAKDAVIEKIAEILGRGIEREAKKNG